MENSLEPNETISKPENLEEQKLLNQPSTSTQKKERVGRSKAYWKNRGFEKEAEEETEMISINYNEYSFAERVKEQLFTTSMRNKLKSILDLPHDSRSDSYLNSILCNCDTSFITAIKRECDESECEECEGFKYPKYEEDSSESSSSEEEEEATFQRSEGAPESLSFNFNFVACEFDSSLNGSKIKSKATVKSELEETDEKTFYSQDEENADNRLQTTLVNEALKSESAVIDGEIIQMEQEMKDNLEEQESYTITQRKKSAQRVKAYRQRKKLLNQPSTAAEKEKSAARSKAYRERKKKLNLPTTPAEKKKSALRSKAYRERKRFKKETVAVNSNEAVLPIKQSFSEKVKGRLFRTSFIKDKLKNVLDLPQDNSSDSYMNSVLNDFDDSSFVNGIKKEFDKSACEVSGGLNYQKDVEASPERFASSSSSEEEATVQRSKGAPESLGFNFNFVACEFDSSLNESEVIVKSELEETDEKIFYSKDEENADNRLQTIPEGVIKIEQNDNDETVVPIKKNFMQKIKANLLMDSMKNKLKNILVSPPDSSSDTELSFVENEISTLEEEKEECEWVEEVKSSEESEERSRKENWCKVTTERNLECVFCRKNFVTQELLNEHILCHATAEKQLMNQVSFLEIDLEKSIANSQNIRKDK